MRRFVEDSKAFWNRNRLVMLIVVMAIAGILLFVGEYILQSSTNGEDSWTTHEPNSLVELFIAIGVIVVVALLSWLVTNGVLVAIRYPSRLDVMVRQSLLFMAGLLVTVLVCLTWTPLPRILGIEGMGGWQKLLTAGGVVTLCTAIVGLVISYRKQRDAEDGKFTRDFAEAASQLGDTSPSTRIAGVYAMAALADSSYLRRQRCIDVLCAYLRIPYSPEISQSGITERTVVAQEEAATRTDTFTYSPGEREVRLSIVRVIRDRLQPEPIIGWHGHDFDFTGAVFDEVDFRGADFSDGRITFDKAKFFDAVCDFQSTVFSGANVSFTQAEFRGTYLDFDFIELHEGSLSFAAAEFHDSRITFVLTSFTGGTLDFGGVILSKTDTSFLSAKFEGTYAAFDNAALKQSELRFNETLVSEGVINLDFVELQDSTINLDDAQFSATQEVEISLAGVSSTYSSVVKDGENFYGYRWPPYGT